MTHSDAFLSGITEGDRPAIELGDNSAIDSNGIGTGVLAVDNNNTCPVPNMLHVPRLGKSLLSMGQATTVGLKFVADDNFMKIYSKDGYSPPAGRVVARISKVDNLNPMRLVLPPSPNPTAEAASSENCEFESAAFAIRGPAAIEENIWHYSERRIPIKRESYKTSGRDC